MQITRTDIHFVGDFVKRRIGLTLLVKKQQARY